MEYAEIQSQCNAAMDYVFEHFKRTQKVTFYKSAAEEIVVNDSSWNSDFSDPYAANIIQTAQSRDVSCRIWYFKDSEVLKSLDGDENINLKISYPIGKVRIQVKAEDFEWLKGAKSFYILNEKFVKESDWRGVGMLGEINRYEIILRRNQ